MLAETMLMSPVGVLRLVASETGLVAVIWENSRPGRVWLDAASAEVPGHAVLQCAVRELREYFAGERRVFSVPLDLRGTPFQMEVWEALRRIPFGETRSYGAVAVELGNAKATRAVGAANGRNPVAIVVPCHRVVGSGGGLTGFAGGLEAKERLLRLEGRERGLFG